VEQLVQAALQADPELASLAHRLRPRFQQLEGAQERELLCWGEQNLATCQNYSRELAAVTQRLSQLSVDEWVRKCNEASTRPPGGWLAAFKHQDSPDDYEKRFRQLQGEMGPMIQKLGAIEQEVRPELEDLRLDAAALHAAAVRYTDPTLGMLIDNRWRTLVQGQQVAAQTIATAAQSKALLIKHCQTLDQLLSVTLPAWRLAR
jgi:hypothetical protein